MNNKTKIILIIILIAVIGLIFVMDSGKTSHADHWENDLGTIDKNITGNPNSTTEMIMILGIHPREKLSIDPELESAKEFASKNDVKLVVYYVDVEKNETDYELSRANGESLVHDYIVPDITDNEKDAKAIIISHSHIPGYGEGFYLATPAMDDASVKIAEQVANESDFNYFPRNTSQPLQASSAILVSKPLADAGFPTFVYEIPENITEQDSTDKGIELLGLIYDIIKK